jgi:hypothetical protein
MMCRLSQLALMVAVAVCASTSMAQPFPPGSAQRVIAAGGVDLKVYTYRPAPSARARQYRVFLFGHGSPLNNGSIRRADVLLEPPHNALRQVKHTACGVVLLADYPRCFP